MTDFVVERTMKLFHLSTSTWIFAGHRPPVIPALTAVFAAGAILGSLWPFDFELPVVENGARYRAGGTLAFAQAGIARSPGVPGWLENIKEGRSLMLEARVRSFAAEQSGPARIFTISHDPRERNLTVGQDGANLILRVRTLSSDRNGKVNGRPVIEVPNLFSTRRWLDVQVRIASDIVSVASGGAEYRHVLRGPPFGRWDRGFRLALGNELTNDRPWLGEIAFARACTAADCVNLLAPDALRLPDFLWVHPRPQLLPSLDYGARDAVVNYAGYVPLGVLLALAFPRSRAGPRVLAVLGCVVLLSVTMELSQVFLPSRHPSINDVLLNLAGGATGTALASFGAAMLRCGGRQQRAARERMHRSEVD